VSNSSLAAPSTVSDVLNFAVFFWRKHLEPLPTGNCYSFLNSTMPDSGHRHGHHGYNHKHKRRRHRSSDDPQAPEFRWEWFWTCCNCYGNGAMSTFIDQCPGCTHTRCADCPMESVKIRVSTEQRVHGLSTPSAQASQAPEAFNRNDSSIAS
jgi:hypothetical protein